MRLRSGQRSARILRGARAGNSLVRLEVRLAARSFPQVKSRREVQMEGPTLCAQCDLPEDRCTCERYCTICKGQLNVRLCSDGLYYCPDCREACDVSLASRGH